MKIFEKPIKVYRKDGVSKSGKPYSMYSTPIKSKKGEEWLTAWLKLGFPNGVTVPNKSTIKFSVDNCSFYPLKNFATNSIEIQLFVAEFEMVEDGETFNPTDDFMSTPDFSDVPFN